ncbi:MAG: hypothetical protein RML36_11050 [Anaerolineae bacterium]|nr:hypothetical protein [Anaerolineae bacterium]MDW8100004.1 hypothetical protein [Anaerolineae bacterium]
MAKRSQRPGRAARPQRYSKGRVSAQTAAQAAPATPVARAPARPVTVAAPPVTAKVDFAKEYHYVIQDLRRLFVLAVALMTLLIVLAYFLT